MVERKHITVQNFSVAFPVGAGWLKAVDDITAEFAAGQYTAIIGESGCGKSVLGQAILGILPDSVRQSGSVLWGGEPLDYAAQRSLFGIIPQNPSDSLNPVRRICRQFQDLLDVHGIEDKRHAYKTKCLQFFGLEDTARVLQAYPYELSGGMLQRVLCAMAISTKPAWLLADEPTKGLDEQNGAVALQNLQKMKCELATSMIIITHDIKLARDVCDTVLIMYAGQVMERSGKFFSEPLHPYSQGFLQALPENGLHTIAGKAPAPGTELAGCRFAGRCPHCIERCRQERPELYKLADGRQVRCFLYAEG